jgi:LacI family transcriptional regulator
MKSRWIVVKEKSPTMEDIAKKLNVSKYAVSLALSNKKGVSEETRQRVIQTAHKMGYRNTRTRSKNRSNIAIIISAKAFKDPYFFSYIINEIERECRYRKYSVNILSIDETFNDINAISAFMFNNDIDGAIVISNIGDKLISEIKEYAPIVIVDHYVQDEDIDCIITDNYQGVYLAIEYLVKKAKLSRIGFIGDMTIAISYYERWQAFKDSMYKFGLDVDMDLCKIDGFDDFAENPRRELEAFISGMEQLPEAFFCVSDMSAVSLSNILIKQGLEIPEDISILGFDNTKLAQLNIPPLTMVHIFKEYYGKKAVEQLIQRMEYPNKPAETIRIKTELIERKSVLRGYEVSNIHHEKAGF